MTPDEFIRRWEGNPLTERASAQSWFIDLCALLGLDHPSPDTAGAFEFERGATKATGGKGWADVWRAGAFAWEFKGTGRDLDAAYAQVQRYAPALDNPPLLIVSDTQTIVIRTAFTGAVQERHDIALPDLRDAAARDLLTRAFETPRSFRPRRTRADLTEEAAAAFAALAQRLRGRGHAPQAVAHFVNRLVFCMFAEDVRLLPNKMFERMLAHCRGNPADFEANSRTLFAAMRTGGPVGFERVEWFNGGLFDDDATLPLEAADLAELLAAARMDWSQIDASLLGTLFERGLDPAKRSQLGAHYTDAAKIMQIVEPVVLRPLRAEWEAARAAIEVALDEERDATARAARAGSGAKAAPLTRRANRAHARAVETHLGFLERLRAVRVLDPACGSGNFLNIVLTQLKDLEHVANLGAEQLGLPRPAPAVGPECVLGLEISPYAAELARVSVWIGEIQWMRRNGFEAGRNPILKPLDTIRNVDALLEWPPAPSPPEEDGTSLAPAPEPGPRSQTATADANPAAPPRSAVPIRRTWPEAEFIVGNPPFLGNKRMVGELGEDYATALRRAWKGVPGGVDLVAYWFAAAWEAVAAGRARRVGLVSTNSIRGGANRSVLAGPAEAGAIFEAWSDEPWTVEGAAVRVSMVMFGEAGAGEGVTLDGAEVERTAADLTAGLDLTVAERLGENRRISSIGDQKTGPFDVSRDEAEIMLRSPGNPNGRPNSDVVRPFLNAMDVVRRSSDRWIIDFPLDADFRVASFFEVPFEHVSENVQPMRSKNRVAKLRDFWWLHERPRPELREYLKGVDRYIATPRISKHHILVWIGASVLPDCQLVAIARDDDATFGILHSRFHEAWALRMGTSLEDRPRYTPSTTFETFPFPPHLTPDIPAGTQAAGPAAAHFEAIVEAARALHEARERWLNPPELVRREPEVVAGYPDRLIPVDAEAEKTLKKRTLTNLYNARPAWLAHLHDALDAAVAAAYGWPEDIPEDDALTRLLALNRERAGRGPRP